MSLLRLAGRHVLDVRTRIIHATESKRVGYIRAVVLTECDLSVSQHERDYTLAPVGAVVNCVMCLAVMNG